MAEQLNNIRMAYQTLQERVSTALRTQMGDTYRLGLSKSDALALLQAAEQVR